MVATPLTLKIYATTRPPFGIVQPHPGEQVLTKTTMQRPRGSGIARRAVKAQMDAFMGLIDRQHPENVPIDHILIGARNLQIMIAHFPDIDAWIEYQGKSPCHLAIDDRIILER